METDAGSINYFIDMTNQEEDYMLRLKKSGDKHAIKKNDKILQELQAHPETGIGNPEKKKYGFAGCWSRQITEKHRIVYIIDDENRSVIVLKAFGHYNDK
jgi:toxin YoeB